MSESKVTLSKLVGQAWGQLQEMVLEEIRRRVEELAEAERESLLGRGRHVRRGGPLRRWGYRVRKVLLTPWGMISGLRLPRIRDVEAKREVAFLSSEGNQARLAEMLLASTLGGMSYRKVVNWARRHLGAVISADWVGRVVAEAAARIEDRRQERFSHRAFEALVVDVMGALPPQSAATPALGSAAGGDRTGLGRRLPGARLGGGRSREYGGLCHPLPTTL